MSAHLKQDYHLKVKVSGQMKPCDLLKEANVVYPTAQRAIIGIGLQIYNICGT